MASGEGEPGAADSFVSFLENSPQRYRSAKARILERRALLEKAGVDVLKPCSGGEDKPCWLRNHLAALNEVFTKAVLELSLRNATGLAITPAFGLYPNKEDSVIAEFLVDWFLAHHVCIHELRLKRPSAACWVLPGVRCLDVSGVPAKSLVKAVQGGKRLESIRIDEVKKPGGYVDDLASALRELPSLKSLEFRKNEFPTGSFGKIFEAVSGSEKLESLSLQIETLSADDVRALQQLLQRVSSLKKLTLEFIDEGSISEITSGTVQGSALEELRIFGIEYAGDVHKTLPLSFTGILNNLRILKLSCSDIKDDVAVNVAKHLAQNASLKEVDLSSNSIGESGAVALAAALKENSTLERLYLSGNELSSAAFRAFAEALNANKTLKELDVSEVDLSDEGSNELFEADSFPGLFNRARIFWQQNRLKELATIVHTNEHHASLSVEIDDRVSLSDLDALFDALSVNTTVTKLNIFSECDLFPAFASRLASFLRTNTRVGDIAVRLDANSEVLLLDILEALKENTSVWRCDVSAIEVTPAIARVAKDLLKTNATLNTLCLCLRDVYELNKESLRLIAEGLLENTTVVDLHVAWEPQVVDGLPEIWQLLARNKLLVSLAALCVTGSERSQESVEAFRITRKSHALVEKVAEVSGKTEELAKEAIAEAAGRLLDS